MLIPNTIIQAGGAGAITQLYDNTLSVSTDFWDITGISQAYNHLKIIMAVRTDEAVVLSNFAVNLNGDGGANYDGQYTQANNVTTDLGPYMAQTNWGVFNVVGANATANVFSPVEINLYDYTSTSHFKVGWASNSSLSTLGTASSYRLYSHGLLWRSTAAINRIKFDASGPNFVAGSRLTIYGLL